MQGAAGTFQGARHADPSHQIAEAITDQDGGDVMQAPGRGRRRSLATASSVLVGIFRSQAGSDTLEQAGGQTGKQGGFMAQDFRPFFGLIASA